MLPQQVSATLACTSKIAENRQSELLERRARLDDPLEARDDPSLCRFLLPRLVEATEIVASLEYVIGHFLVRSVSTLAEQGVSYTYRAVRPRTLLVEDLDQDLDGIGVLKDLEQVRVHGQMLDCFEHMHQVLRLKKFASSK